MRKQGESVIQPGLEVVYADSMYGIWFKLHRIIAYKGSLANLLLI